MGKTVGSAERLRNGRQKGTKETKKEDGEAEDGVLENH